MIVPGLQWETPVLLACSTCGTANSNKLPWTASNFILVSCSNPNCQDYGVSVLVEKSSLTVITVAESGGKG
jgi:hypothetical protein